MSRWLRLSLVAAVLAGLTAGLAVASFSRAQGSPSLGDLEAGLVSALTSALLFVIVYSIREPWWRNWIGRFIVSHVLAYSMVCLPFVLSFFFNFNRLDNEVALWVLLTVLYGSGAILMLGTILWLHTSMTGAQKEKAADADDV
jgi:hypothetical protein